MAARSTSKLAVHLGARIRQLRLERELTQERLSWECGFTKSHVSQIESGKTMPSIQALSVIAKYLGVHLVDFFTWDASDARAPLVEALRVGDVSAVHTSLARLGVRVRGG